MVLGKLPVPGRPTYLDYSRARAYCACSRCRWGLFGHVFSLCPFSPLSPSLWETVRYRLKYCLKGPLNPKQPTNQPTKFDTVAFPILTTHRQVPAVPAVGAGHFFMPLTGHCSLAANIGKR